KSQQMHQAIGIDLGTTFSCVAYMKNDKEVEVVENSYGNKITPSVVHFGSQFKEVGEAAQSKRGTDALNTVFQVKRFMGRSGDDPEIKKRPYPFEFLSTRRGEAAIRVSPVDQDGTVQSKTISPEQISSVILNFMKACAQEKIGSEVKDAVITVPANFNNAQKQATKTAGEMIGLNVLRIVSEPTAAAIAYGFGINSEKKRTVLVYDLGGGTFDVSIVRIQRMDSEVLSTAGVTDLGGEDFDRRLFEYACSELKKQVLTITSDEEFGLNQSCEQAKITLTACDRANIDLYRDGKRYGFEISRSMFEELCIDLFEKTIECVEDAIDEAKVDKESIDDIVLVGGSSRIPKVQELVRELFGEKELKFNIPPDHAVAYGAAILAQSLSSAKDNALSSIRGLVTLADVLPLSLGTGITCDRFRVMLRRNTQYPATATHTYENSIDNQKSIYFEILEGENALSSKNKKLGSVSIPVPDKNVGENNIQTTFSVDEDGILSVHLLDADTEVKRDTKVQTSKLTEAERMVMVRNAKKEGENEEIERAKFEARTTFADVLTKARRTVHRTESESKKERLQFLIEKEENWLASQENPSNEEIIFRAGAAKQKLAQIMTRDPWLGNPK
ncbi:hypothetical protein PENTCL1PPCAC_19539, partial [Pristionchus entomophagus]